MAVAGVDPSPVPGTLHDTWSRVPKPGNPHFMYNLALNLTSVSIFFTAAFISAPCVVPLFLKNHSHENNKNHNDNSPSSRPPLFIHGKER